VDAFDADVLIFAAAPDDRRGRLVRALFAGRAADESAGIGSTMLVPEVLTKPLRNGEAGAVTELTWLLGRLELLPVDTVVAQHAVALGAAYKLRAADSVHLATAVLAGADRFITNNRKDFPKSIVEIDVTYPDELT
jgi:predicted nucleic acid-binding protein